MQVIKVEIVSCEIDQNLRILLNAAEKHLKKMKLTKWINSPQI